jgi:septum formation protein
MDLILASQSPRRRALLVDLGLEFTTLATDIDETPHPNEAPDTLAVRLSEAKARAAARTVNRQSSLILASDTVVALGDKLLGKPVNGDDARRMLQHLRGRTHVVHTAVSALAHPDGPMHTRLNTSRITMRAYSDAEIDAYIATGDPLDKAGAYAIQHPVFAPVARLDGCFAGVMGFPLGDVCELLGAWGIDVQAAIATVCRRHGSQACCYATQAERELQPDAE